MSEPNIDTTVRPDAGSLGNQTEVPPSQPVAPPATPPTPAPQPNAPAQPNAPNTSAQPTQPTQPTPRHLAGKIFDGVLNTLGGGPIYVNKTDPTTGATTRVAIQQSRGQLGKSILAGALAGMFGGMGARDPEGRPDPAKAASMGFQAGTQLHEKQQAVAQQLSDEDTSRRQMVMKSNLDLAHQTLALNQGKQNMFEKIATNNQNGILKDAQAYDQSLTDKEQPKAILKTGLSHDEALAALKGHWSDQLAQIDGYSQDANGDIVPTFSILNPDVKIKLSEEQAKEFARFNPQYTTAWDATSGNIRMSLHNYADTMNKYNSLEHMDALFGQEAAALGLKSTDFADAVKKVGPIGMKAVIDAENAIAGGGTPIDALRRLSVAQGGAQILNVMGVTPEKVNELYNKQIADQKLAEMGGMGEKAPQAEDQTKRQLDAINSNPDLTDSDRKTLFADIPTPDKDGKIHMTQGQGTKLMNTAREMVNTNKQIAERNALANGDPVQMQKTAQNTIEGDVNDITAIASMRGNARTNAINAMHDYAQSLGLDTTNYSEAALKSQADMWRDYTGGQKTPTGKQLVSFDSYLGHTGAALAAQQRLADKYMGLKHQPILNKTMKELGKELTDDKDWAAYSASLEPVKHEIENFLAAGFATKSEDAEAMRAILNDTLPINRMNATLKQLADTADVRLAALGKAYTSNLGRNYSRLLSPDSQKTLEKLGIKSQAAAYSAALPRGWNNHQLTQLKDPKIAKMFLEAAGNRVPDARELMKRNGWLD